VQRLERAKARLDELTIDSSEWRAIRKGLHRTYRLGRDAMAEAPRDASDNTLHEWRKRAKDLRYQLQFLCKAWPGVMNAG
jgi:CHAD domain-containing protein